MRLAARYLLASTLIVTPVATAQADIDVVASIKPLHSLVAAVMNGVGEPGLIIEGAASPHTFALKPSKGRMLEQADVVFWIGPEIETFLEKPLETIASRAAVIEMVDTPGLVQRSLREGGAFEAHDHGHQDKHDHDKHDHGDHGEGEDHKEDHDDHADEGRKHHGHGAFNAHVWLDPINAKALVHEIEETLAKADPSNAAKYEANAVAVNKRLDALTVEIGAQLAPVKGRDFIVFHDAYQAFEDRFGLTAVGSITVSPEMMPGADRLSALRAKIRELGVSCVFSEPQFEPRLVTTLTEGTAAKSGVLDPLGASLTEGPDLYFELLHGLAASFKACLTEAS